MSYIHLTSMPASKKVAFTTPHVIFVCKRDAVKVNAANPSIKFQKNQVEEKNNALKQEYSRNFDVQKVNETATIVCPKPPLVSYNPVEKVLAYIVMSLINIKSFGSIRHPM